MKMPGILHKIKRRMSRDYPLREVRFDGDGLRVFEEGVSRGSIRWTDVIEVFAYKLDCFTVDEICIGFRIDEAGTHYWVSEEFVGYKQLVEELNSRFPGIRTDWFSDVAFPAFVENRTSLWGTPWPLIQK